MGESKKPLRILLIGPAAPPMGGIVRYAQDMTDSELNEYNEITLFQDNIPSEYRPTITTASNTWNIIRRDGIISTIKVFNFLFWWFVRLWKTLSNGRYDIVHVLSTAGFGFFRNSCCIWMAKKRKVKTIFHLLGQIDDLHRDGNPMIKRMVSLCLDFADVHLVQSPMLAEYVRNITAKPVYFIFNGVKTEELNPPNGYAHSNGMEIKIVTLGYLGYQKGTFDIIEAAVKIKEILPSIQFVFVGGGEVEKFKAIAAQKQLSDNTHFLGRVDDRERIVQLHSSDIFLLPSYAEGQPIALLEAMAAGLPVISSKVGSIPEVVKEGINGFLIQPGNTDSIVEYLKVLIFDKELRERMGRTNAKEAGEKYELQRVMSEIQSVYNQLMN